jgi:hypothetical protein
MAHQIWAHAYFIGAGWRQYSYADGRKRTFKLAPFLGKQAMPSAAKGLIAVCKA